jgi:hypothetical protein
MAYVTTVEEFIGTTKKGKQLYLETDKYEFCYDIWNYILDFTDIKLKAKIREEIKELKEEKNGLVKSLNYNSELICGTQIRGIHNHTSKELRFVNDLEVGYVVNDFWDYTYAFGNWLNNMDNVYVEFRKKLCHKVDNIRNRLYDLTIRIYDLYTILNDKDKKYFNNKHFDTTEFRVGRLVESNKYRKVGRKLQVVSIYRIMEVSKKYVVVTEVVVKNNIVTPRYKHFEMLKITKPCYFKHFIY